VVTRLLRSPVAWVAAAVLAAGAAFGLYWFQPWKLVTDRTVSEQLSSVNAAPATPSASAPVAPSASAPVAPAPPAGPLASTPAAAPAGPTVVASGEFITHEHDTTGRARIVRAADGSHTLELVGLDTSNGPDLRVWLTDQPVIEGVDGWRVFDDGEWVELGRLKGNKGDQAYAVPAGLDPKEFRSVSIWCKRFSVSFGAAPLAAG
jgi:hypothetical protein